MRVIREESNGFLCASHTSLRTNAQSFGTFGPAGFPEILGDCDVRRTGPFGSCCRGGCGECDLQWGEMDRAVGESLALEIKAGGDGPDWVQSRGQRAEGDGTGATCVGEKKAEGIEKLPALLKDIWETAEIGRAHV